MVGSILLKELLGEEIYSEKEAKTRWETNKQLILKGTISPDELRASELNYLKLKYERIENLRRVRELYAAGALHFQCCALPKSKRSRNWSTGREQS